MKKIFLIQVFLSVFLIGLLVSLAEAQKGGAKGAMRRGGGKRGRSGGSSSRGGYNQADDTGDGGGYHI